MLEQVERLNSGILSVSDADRYVTLLLAEIDVQKRKLQYVNCGHNPALLFRATTGTPTHLDSPCPPIGLSPEEICELSSANLAPGDVVVFHTDGVTEAKTPLGEEFGMERLSARSLQQRAAAAPAKVLSLARYFNLRPERPCQHADSIQSLGPFAGHPRPNIFLLNL
jgi:serine phosphatase RsbU (regulator of sigma subunit)